MSRVRSESVHSESPPDTAPTGDSPNELLHRLNQIFDAVSSELSNADAPQKVRVLQELSESVASVRQSFTLSMRATHTEVVTDATAMENVQSPPDYVGEARRLVEDYALHCGEATLAFFQTDCVGCTDAALQLFRTTRSELLGSWPRAFLAARDATGQPAGRLLKSLIEDCSDAPSRRVVFLLCDSGGREFRAQIQAHAVNFGCHQLTLVTVRDVSAIESITDRMERLRAALQHMVGDTSQHLVLQSNVEQLSQLRFEATEAMQVAPSDVADRRTGLHSDADMLIVQTDRVSETIFTNDVEDRRRDDRLRLLASVFNGASEGVAILSPDGEIREANPAFLEMIAAGTDTPIGQRISETLSFEVPDFDLILKRVVAGKAWSGKSQIVDHRQQSWSYWVSLSPSLEMDDSSSRIIALVSDITELENTQAKLRREALYDNLTGLPNRRFFREYLQQLIDDPAATPSGLVVCFLDLDDFKHVNDSAGHSTGDRLLRAVGQRIRAAMGIGAFVARFGGDEFAIILTEESRGRRPLTGTLDTLMSRFREPFALQTTEAVVGLSIGVTRYPQHGMDVDTLMCNADIAMYEAKAAGKNRIRVFTPAMQEGVNSRHRVQTMLRRALNSGEISLCYQPKVHANSREPAGCEALARWRTADGALIPPNEFIPVAEQTGLILPLGDLVFQHAAVQAQQWAEQGMTPKIAVNISPLQLRHPRFVEQLQVTLDEAGAEAEWFELEITEHAMMDDVERAIGVIEELACLGFRVAIDDFGTGYSSLSYLKSFRIHTLKIDLSFVRDLTRDPQSIAIVRSIVSLGTGLNLTVVAEGVETAEQAAVLADIGCHVLQGFHIGEPMSADQYLEWLDKQ